MKLWPPTRPRNAVRAAAAIAIRGALKVFHRFDIVGRENLPLGESFIIVCNHTSHLDAVCLVSALPLRQLSRTFPAAAADYFFTSVAKLRFSRLLVNALPFHRDAHIRQSMDLCRQLLAGDGNVLIIFPEGTRSSDGEIAQFKRGVGMLLAGTEIPVVPCHLGGCYQALPKGSWLPRLNRIQLRIGHPRRFAGCEPRKESAQRICNELRQAVIDLASQPIDERGAIEISYPELEQTA